MCNNMTKESLILRDVLPFLTIEQKYSLLSIFIRRYLMNKTNVIHKEKINNIIKSIDLKIYKIFDTSGYEREANIILLTEEISLAFYSYNMSCISVETIEESIQMFIYKYLN